MEFTKTALNGIFGRYNDYEIREDLSGKVALVTGGSSGIGRVTCLELAKKGCHVFIGARNKEKTLLVIDEIIKECGGNAKVEFLHLELEDLQSVKDCAIAFLSRNLPLHILINNAGVASANGCTKQGYTRVFGVNHLAHFLLTNLLLERLKESAPSRIIIVSSVAHNYGSPYDFGRIKSPDNESIKSYCDSKLANVMHAKKLAIELKETGVKVYSLHPGSVATDIWRKFPSFMQSVIKTFTISETQGARVTLFCATEPSISNESGKYYDMCKEGKVGKLANDEKLIDELWIKSNEFTKDYQ